MFIVAKQAKSDGDAEARRASAGLNKRVSAESR